MTFLKGRTHSVELKFHIQRGRLRSVNENEIICEYMGLCISKFMLIFMIFWGGIVHVCVCGYFWVFDNVSE